MYVYSIWMKSLLIADSITVTRSVTVRAMGGDQQLRPVDKTIASTVGGSAAGAVAGLIREYS